MKGSLKPGCKYKKWVQRWGSHEIFKYMGIQSRGGAHVFSQIHTPCNPAKAPVSDPQPGPHVVLPVLDEWMLEVAVRRWYTVAFKWCSVTKGLRSVLRKYYIFSYYIELHIFLAHIYYTTTTSGQCNCHSRKPCLIRLGNIFPIVCYSVLVTVSCS